MFKDFLFEKKSRKKAFKEFEKRGLPTTKNEDWKYTNLYQLKNLNFKKPALLPHEYMSKNVGIRNYLDQVTLSPWKAVFIDGYFSQEFSTLPSLKGLEILPLRDAAKKYESKINYFFKKTIKNKTFVQLNKALAYEGAYIKAEAGFEGLGDPIVCIHMATQKDVAVNLRNIIELSTNSKLNVVEVYKGLEGGSFNNYVTQVQLNKDAKLDYIKSQEEFLRSYHFHTLDVELGSHSSFTSHLFSLGSLLCRNEVEIKFKAPHSQGMMNGLFAGTENQHIDNNTFVDHLAEGCKSEQQYKGILDGSSHGVFSGEVHVAKNSQKTDARQRNQNLLLSSQARIDTKPSLMIYADDVKCSHGATIGELDKQAVFYLQSRGIQEDLAKQILTKAFANEMVEKIEHEKSKIYFDKLLNSWFRQQVLH